MKRTVTLLLALAALIPALCAENPKREFRGAWLHVVGDISYKGKTPQQQKKMITDYLDHLEEAGVNAIIFQVRPSADALYVSEIEPWSSWLTGKRGQAPEPLWDPMQFVLEESHKRGMEFHAWLNPYRVTLASEQLPASHPAVKGDERYFKYNGMWFFDPGMPENREYIAKVVKDILTRYDVDAIHMDDYFYPYPGKTPFNADSKSYAKYGNGKNIGDWRRENVDKLMKELHELIHREKPWVRFGISPFGIYRNKKNDPEGSDTNGFENYSGLYADVTKWAKNGWVDYLAPQLYWELDHNLASSRKLAKWWNDHSYGVPVYIGQDVRRTMDTRDSRTGEASELNTKIKISRELENVGGNIWWHGYWLADNYKGSRDSVSYGAQATLALPPVYGDAKVRPRKVSGVKAADIGGETFLVWDRVQNGAAPRSEDVVKYVVYEFFEDERPDIDDAATIIAVTPYAKVKLTEASDAKALKGLTFAVTAVDRLNRESEPVFYKP